MLSLRRAAVPGALVLATSLTALVSPAASASTTAAPTAHAGTAKQLPLGPSGLSETRTTTTIAPGLTMTTITRGKMDPAKDYWTIGINLPIGDPTDDNDQDSPKALLGTKAEATAIAGRLLANSEVAAQLEAKGWKPRVEAVDWVPEMKDFKGGLIGYTLRLGRWDAAPTSADPLYAAVVAAGLSPAVVFTGQDGRPDNTGPWVVRSLTIDFKRFQGNVSSTLGSAVSGRETTTALARSKNAIYAVNGGFFVTADADGAQGIPAGLSVVDGKVKSAAINGRAALLLGDGGRDTEVSYLQTHFSVKAGKKRQLVDGLNRTPGVIRNCGGVGGDVPTQRPVQDFTCTDDSEIIGFTDDYGTTLPTGAGVEVVVGARGKVTAVQERTGGTVPKGSTVLQGIGTGATWLSKHAPVGTKITLDTKVTDERGRRVSFGKNDSVVNGGPVLVHKGKVSVDVRAEGMIHEDPELNLPDSALGAAWGYSWVVRDNPRTGAGVDSQGRLLLVQADGRQSKLSQGLSIPDFAAVMKSLGAVEAFNLDGGGSSATVVNGTLVSSPSDTSNGAQVERSDGDALVVTAPRR
ncbi:phosphodiester glycosidase family protein [Kineosporia mesophila]|uniref:Phosphodiester glycosidase family protein n=1 Tax=Kineosporia mesophila TaxID=566012 RepID=A0ABP6ZVT0_9ACTN|nr:phosphodiester glycosidase family protein [Kineosporia mesophila]MCD5348783.1 phosphodiester glycosidase family protein [Kineosporia mesophila]